MSVAESIEAGVLKPGSIYARFAELTPFESPLEEQQAQWKVRGACLLPPLPLLAPLAAGAGAAGIVPLSNRLHTLWASGHPISSCLACTPWTYLQHCGYTQAAALKAQEAYPPRPAITGTVLAQQPQATAAAAAAAATAAAAAAGPLGTVSM